MPVTLYHWIIFNVIIFLILGIDLWRSYRNPHPIKVKEALLTSCGWILLALAFNGWIYWTFGTKPALEFLTGYLVEESLSIDNLFIFLLIFTHFKVPEEAKHSILFYGVLGAIVMRGLLIWAGIALVENFDWIFIIFGLFLIITGIRLGFKSESNAKLEEGFVYKWLTNKLRFTTYQGSHFFVRQNNQWFATPLFAILILIEMTDLIFALDSVPAILGITTEPFIVYTSNIFAILGLRSLFFALEGMMKTFYLLHYALAFILVFIGCKMLIMDFFHIPILITLMVLIGSLIIAVVASLIYPPSNFKVKIK